MLDFIDTRHFGASCVGLSALGIAYIAGMDSWLVTALPMLGIAAYYLIFEEDEERRPNLNGLLRLPNWLTAATRIVRMESALACHAQAVQAQRRARQKAASAFGQAPAKPDASGATITPAGCAQRDRLG